MSTAIFVGIQRDSVIALPAMVLLLPRRTWLAPDGPSWLG